jgi:hypothetical protein
MSAEASIPNCSHNEPKPSIVIHSGSSGSANLAKNASLSGLGSDADEFAFLVGADDDFRDIFNPTIKGRRGKELEEVSVNVRLDYHNNNNNHY